MAKANNRLTEIDRVEKNRSQFVVDAVRRELELRRQSRFHRLLDNPHPESLETAELGFDQLGAEPCR